MISRVEVGISNGVNWELATLDPGKKRSLPITDALAGRVDF
jgi:hypothetical protein